MSDPGKTPGKYHLIYSVEAHPEGIEEDLIDRKTHGGCDAMVFISVIHGVDGSRSSAILSLDGRNGAPMTATDLWKEWASLTWHLSQLDDLGEGRREFCQQVYEVIRDAVLAGKRDG